MIESSISGDAIAIRAVKQDAVAYSAGVWWECMAPFLGLNVGYFLDM